MEVKSFRERLKLALEILRGKKIPTEVFARVDERMLPIREEEIAKRKEEKLKHLEEDRARLLRKILVQRREMEEMKKRMKYLEKMVKEKVKKEEKKAIEAYKRIRKQKEVKVYISSNPPVQIVSLDRREPFLSPDGEPCRYLCGLKFFHVGAHEPAVYLLVGTKPVQVEKKKIPKNIYRLVLPDGALKISVLPKLLAEPDMLVYCLKYGVPVTFALDTYAVESTAAKNSFRIFAFYGKPIKVSTNNGDSFIAPDGTKLKFLVGFDLVDSRFGEPIAYPLLSDEKLAYRPKKIETYTIESESPPFLSELYMLPLKRQNLVRMLIKGKPVISSIGMDGTFVRDSLDVEIEEKKK